MWSESYFIVDKPSLSSYSVGQVELVSVIKQLSQELAAGVISPDCLILSQYSVLGLMALASLPLL